MKTMTRKTKGNAVKSNGKSDGKSKGSGNQGQADGGATSLRLDAWLALVGQLDASVPHVVQLTTWERMHSSGRLREGEKEAMLAVLDAVEAVPRYFPTLGSDEEGVRAVTTQDLRGWLEERDRLERLAEPLREILGRVDDTILHLGDLARPPLLGAYEVARIVAQRDPALRRRITTALEFYASISRKGFVTRTRKGDAGPTGEAEPAEPDIG